MSENDFEFLASTGVNTLETISPNRRTSPVWPGSDASIPAQTDAESKKAGLASTDSEATFLEYCQGRNWVAIRPQSPTSIVSSLDRPRLINKTATAAFSEAQQGIPAENHPYLTFER